MLYFTSNRDLFEIKELANVVRRFATNQLTDDHYRRIDFEKMAELGLPGMSVSEQHAGLGSSSLEISAAIFELAREQLGPAIYLSVHLMVSKLIERWSNTTLTAPLLTELAQAKKLGAYCLTEAHSGSDAAALRTRAEKSGDTWVLNGEKIYISSGGVADIYLVFARTSEDKTKGISAFLIPKETTGLSFGLPEKKMGCRGSTLSSVVFENCTIPDSSLVGEVGQGYKIALSGLNGGRVSIAAAACGLASKSIELARKHLLERKQFDQPLANFQGLQFMLAEMYMKLRASVLLTREAAIELDQGGSDNTPASIAKCFATDSAMQITTDGVQLLGGAGYIEEYQVERLMRDAKMLQIVEGTNQIQRMLIARALLQ